MNSNSKLRKAISDFVKQYTQTEVIISEKSKCSTFWIGFIKALFNEEHFDKFLNFEKSVKDQNSTKWLDVYIERTKTLIEQKSSDIDLDKPQSGHKGMTPYEQAKEYQDLLPLSEKVKWIIISNFKEFHIYNMDVREPLKSKTVIKLEELPKRYNEFSFMIDNTVERIIQEKEISFKAGKIIGEIYNLLIAEFTRKGIKPSEQDLHYINITCVRLVFCLYAEDAGMFNDHQQFGQFLNKYKSDPTVFRGKLIELFHVLNTETDKRSIWLEQELKDFPYVNGGLFAKEIDLPAISKELIDYLIDKGSFETDWSQISPTIFGAIFESTLNQVTRRVGGMHYTSIENIHKVIDPLFMDELKAEYNEIVKYKQLNVRVEKLLEFQNKLASLSFLDPACGSGNFLTETYISLRDLEDKILLQIYGQNANYEMFIHEKAQIKVSINQFYGIEINDFAVDVARTALWIAEYQCLQKTKDKGITVHEQTLPLKTNNNLVTANALRMDWNDLIASDKLNYIMGNPPFSGARVMTKNQKKDVETVWKATEKSKNLDYVTCWYKVASDYMMTNKTIQASLVSSNSICQGEQVGILWKELFNRNIVINNAYQTFIWDSESLSKAHVYCVIVQFSYTERPIKHLWLQKSNDYIEVPYINQYLLPYKVSLLENRTTPLSDVPKIGIGNKPIDDGYYLFNEDEMNEFVSKEPKSSKYFKKWYGADEFLKGYCRYCLWLGDCTPAELRSMPLCLDRVRKVKEYRLASKSDGTRKLAEKPTRFHVENMPKGNYIILPEVTTSARDYIPMGFMTPDSISSNLVKLMPDATLFHFGVLESIIHMAWMRIVCGRLGNGYRYSIGIVYNNFIWVKPTEKQKEVITKTAQAILDARNLYPDSTLADLYNPITMPIELKKAHKENDRAVLELYGLSKDATEEQMVARMFELYDAKKSGINNTDLELL